VVTIKALRRCGGRGDGLKLGSINMNCVYHVPRLLQPRETFAAPEYSMCVRGKGGNQSVALARTGARTRHIGAVSPAALRQATAAAARQLTRAGAAQAVPLACKKDTLPT
jgi:ribokinase